MTSLPTPTTSTGPVLLRDGSPAEAGKRIYHVFQKRSGTITGPAADQHGKPGYVRVDVDTVGRRVWAANKLITVVDDTVTVAVDPATPVPVTSVTWSDGTPVDVTAAAVSPLIGTEAGEAFATLPEGPTTGPGAIDVATAVADALRVDEADVDFGRLAGGPSTLAPATITATTPSGGVTVTPTAPIAVDLTGDIPFDLTAAKADPRVIVRATGVNTFGLYFEMDRFKDDGDLRSTRRILIVGDLVFYQTASGTGSSSKKWESTDDIDKFGSGEWYRRGEPIIVQLQNTDVEAVRRGDAPMVRYTAKRQYEKLYGEAPATLTGADVVAA